MFLDLIYYSFIVLIFQCLNVFIYYELLVFFGIIPFKDHLILILIHKLKKYNQQVVGFICNIMMGHILHSSGGHHHGGGSCPHSKPEKDVEDIINEEIGEETEVDENLKKQDIDDADNQTVKDVIYFYF